MPSTFQDFTLGDITNIVSNDFIVGYDTATLGGERRWTLSTIANSVSGVMSAELNNQFGSAGPWILKSSAYTAVDNDKIIANTTSAAFTITLPSTPSVGTNVRFIDHSDTWDTNNLTIARNTGQTIEGLADNLVCNVAGDIVLSLIYNGSTWRVYA
jgi:hypothetical protein